ncbi:MAG: PfkB family carbohydrate kinase [bacterium]
MSVLIVGTVAFDTIETPWGRVERVVGGSATYSALAASFLVPVRVAGVVGEDFTDRHFEVFWRRGIETTGVARERGKTFFWAGRYGENPNERETLATELNVFENFTPRLPEDYRDSRHLFLANMAPEIQMSVLDSCVKARFSILDTMDFWIGGSREALEEAVRRVDCVLMNDGEARQFSRASSLAGAAERILGMGPRVVVIKKGEHGAEMFTKKSHSTVPAYPVGRLKDPTGAGDTFAGGLLGYVATAGRIGEGVLRKAMAVGTVLASFCVEEFGTGNFENIVESDIKGRLKYLRMASRVENVALKIRDNISLEDEERVIKTGL